jgi:hypothetical protein
MTESPLLKLVRTKIRDARARQRNKPWLCVRKSDGWICDYDPDWGDDPVSILNSSILHFVETFHFLNEYLAKNMLLPGDSVKRLYEIDPVANASSNWTSFVDHLSNAKK